MRGWKQALLRDVLHGCPAMEVVSLEEQGKSFGPGVRD